MLYQLSQADIFKIEDIILNVSSLYSVTGLLTVLHAMTMGATRVITATGFDIANMLKLIPHYRVTVAMIPALAIGPLLQYSNVAPVLRQLRILFCSGGGVPHLLQQQLQLYLQAPLQLSYGMSALSGAAARTSPEQSVSLMGSSGQLQSGVRVKLLKSDDVESGREQDGIDKSTLCTVDEEGEICIQVSPPPMGYWSGDRRGEAVHPIVDATGWLHTGDMGRFDADGNLFVVDRLRDMFKSRSVTCTPTELEGMVLVHGGCRVAQICVVSVPEEGTGDELPAALVVRGVPDLTAEEVRAIVEQRCQEEKWLRGGVWFVERLPMTATGKVKRREVRELVRTAFAKGALAETAVT